MKKFQNTLNIAVILSETSHVFCCVLPTVFSVISVLAGIGIVSAVPFWLQGLHAVMHGWEVPVILFSGFVVGLGWALYFYSKKIDCHDTGCHHGPCEPTKKNTNKMLKIATFLFVVNISVYVVFHRGMDVLMPMDQAVQHAEHSEHDH